MSTVIATNIKHASSSTNNLVLNSNGSVTGAGKILQVVQAQKTDTWDSSSTSYADVTGLSVAITPSATSSKILVSVNVNCSASTRYGGLYLSRGSDTIALGDADSSRSRISFSTHSNTDATNYNYIMYNSSMQWLDSPNTTSATTYKLKSKIHYGSGTLYVNRGVNNDNDGYTARGPSVITVMEVSA